MASAFWVLGQQDEAVEWTNRAVDERDCFATHLATSPYYDPAEHRDPRIQQVLKRIGTPLKGQ